MQDRFVSTYHLKGTLFLRLNPSIQLQPLIPRNQPQTEIGAWMKR